MSLKDRLAKMQFGIDQRKSLYQAFLDYLEQGIPLVNIVNMLSKSIVRAEAKSQMFMVHILKDIELQMSTGSQFADALVKWVPIEEVMSIRAGMRSGNPVEGMKNTLESLDASTRMKKVISSKLAYPMILLLAVFGLIIFFSIAIIPRIAEVMPPEKWPDSSKSLYTISTFFREDWYVVVISLVVIVWLVNISLPRLTGKLRFFLDRFPPYSFYRAFHGANMLISVSSLMKSGVPLVNSIKELRTLSSPYMAYHLDEILLKLSEGKDLGSAMDTGILSKDMMVNVYMMSENANFQDAISAIGRFAVERSIELISKAASLLNVLIMLFGACYIGWIYYSFFMVSNAMAGQVAV